jgi:hypothetical protein
VTVSGSIAGLDNNKNITIIVSATGEATIKCVLNPAGKTAPGQNKPKVTSSSSTKFVVDDKNGRVDFSVTTISPETVTGGAGGCPNSKWTAEIVSIDFVQVTITVLDSKGNVIPSLTKIIKV